MDFNKSLYQILHDTSKNYPNNPAICFEKKQITYQSLLKEVDKLASFLQTINVLPKDIVTVCMPNMPQAVIALYAINKIGAICYEVHPKTPKNLMADYLKKVNSKVLLVIDIFSEKYLSLINTLNIKIITFNPYYHNNFILKTICDLKSPKMCDNLIIYEKVKVVSNNNVSYNWNQTDTSVLLNTGGTTGTSKIVEISNLAINKLASDGTKILGFSDPTGVYMLGVLPLFHGFGLCMGIHSPLMYGACVSLMMKFNVKKTIKLINKDLLTIMIGVPTLYKLLLKNSKFKTKKLANITSTYVGGDFVIEKLINEFNNVLKTFHSKARMFEGYGLTETVTVCAVNTIKENKVGSVGRPITFAKIKVVDPETKQFVNGYGELVVSGDILMNGYYQDEIATSKAFIEIDHTKWLLTGDYGFVDSEGFVYFKQRLKRIIKVSGVIVCPSEIEHLLLKINDIHEVYATSIEDEIKGEMVVLFVVKNKASLLKNEELTNIIEQEIKNNLSIYALPKRIIYLPSFPKTDIGKIDGKAIEELKNN